MYWAAALISRHTSPLTFALPNFNEFLGNWILTDCVTYPALSGYLYKEMWC